jgi:hypothetical protein
VSRVAHAKFPLFPSSFRNTAIVLSFIYFFLSLFLFPQLPPFSSRSSIQDSAGVRALLSSGRVSDRLQPPAYTAALFMLDSSIQGLSSLRCQTIHKELQLQLRTRRHISRCFSLSLPSNPLATSLQRISLPNGPFKNISPK